MNDVLELQMPAWARTIDGIVGEWCEHPFGDPFGDGEATAYGQSLRAVLRTDRLLCLFGCACVRPHLDAIEDTQTLARARRMVDAAERLVDDAIRLDRAVEALDVDVYSPDGPIDFAVACIAWMWLEAEDDGEDYVEPRLIPLRTRRYRLNEIRPLRMGELAARAAAYCANAVPREAAGWQLNQGRLLAGIIAPGFRCSPKWRTETVVSLARRIYDARAFGLMPILADALQESGCESDWLAVMRDASWPWCRGCRIIDDLLEKR